MRSVAALMSVVLCASFASAATLEIVNNQPFPIKMPWRLHDGGVVMIDVAASGRQSTNLAQTPLHAAIIIAEPKGDGVHLACNGRDIGDLAWSIVLEHLDKKPTDKEAAGTTHDYAKEFAPLTLKFEQSDKQPLFTTWTAKTQSGGIDLRIDLDVYNEGFIDVRATFINQSAPRDNVYCAVVMRWRQPTGSPRSVDYDNHISPLKDATPFRTGEGRHLFIQRGVDWINTSIAGGSVVMLNDFTPSFTVHRDATAKTPARWVGANTAQLGQEAVVRADAIYSITEIARPNIKMYESRLASNVLPGPDQPLAFTSRFIMSIRPVSDERADQLFIAYTGYNAEEKVDDSTARITFGVPHVKFGTAYFPYSTLGENFEKWHMPGQSQITYWPLSADTVKQWTLFADDIRRDLRIAKAMGFESIRLHHLEMIDVLDRKVQEEYLDFFFGELKHLGLTALLDVKLKPERVAELVKKYRRQIDGVEYDNEVLIFGIDDRDVETWKQVYAAVKEVAPDLPVHWTAHTNTGAFERLKKLDVPFDRLGEHAYMDSLEAIPSARDYALAVATEATKLQKPPLITEWNWRFLTRMTPEARAEVYPPIFENVLKTRCMPVMYQFQFQESLAMASRTLRGIRHYELLNLSRRPRPEAMKFIDLIHTYGDPAAPQDALRTTYQAVYFAQTTIEVPVSNTTDKTLTATVTAEGAPWLSVSPQNITIEPKQNAVVQLNTAMPADAQPGFYHVFVRFDAGENLVSYAWIEIRKPGEPKIDSPPADFSFNRDIGVVYGANATGWEVESAWLIYQTLEAATGRPVKIFQLNDLPPEARKSGAIIAVGTPKTNDLLGRLEGDSSIAVRKSNADHGDILSIAGKDEASLNASAIDFVLRYWKYAKDSGARRIPLVDTPIQKGADPNALP